MDAFLPPRPTPLTIVDPADPRNIGPVTLADPRADAEGVVRATATWSCAPCTSRRCWTRSTSSPHVDAEYGEATGRSWGGLIWEYLLDDAEIVLVAAGSLATQLTVAVEALRDEGVQGRACSASARYRPFPAAALRDAARRRAAGARLRQGALLRLRGPDLHRPAGRAAAARADAPRRLRRRSAASAVATSTPEDLARRPRDALCRPRRRRARPRRPTGST